MGTFISPTYLGDYSVGQTVRLCWGSLNSSGASSAATGSPSVRVYKDGSTTQDIATGQVTLSFDSGDSAVGLNYVQVPLTGSFYTPGSDYFIVLVSVTIDAQTVHATVGHFSIENRTAIAPIQRGAIAASPAPTNSAVTLDTTASTTGSIYNGCLIKIISGTGVGQSRIIYGYTSGKVASVVPNWTVTPAAGDYYQVLPIGSSNMVTINSASSITTASTVNANVTQIDGLATSGNNATLNLKQLNIVNSAGSAIVASSTGSNGDGIRATANGSGKDINATTNTISGNLSGSVNSVTTNVGGNVTGTVGSVLGGVGGSVAGSVTGSVGSVLGNVTVGTNNDKTGYTLSSGGLTSVEGAVWDAARASHTSSGTFGQGVASVTGTVGSVTGGVGGNVSGSVASVTNPVTVGTNNDKTGYALSSSGIGAIWDELHSGHNIAGSFGKYLDSAISGVSTGGVSAGDIAAAVWNEVQSGHTTAGTFGKYLDSAVSGVSTGGVSASDIAAAVWDTTRSGHSTSGTFGQGVSSVVGSVGSVVGAVGSVTGSVGSVTGGVGGSVTGSVGSVASSVTVGTNNDKTGYTLSSGGLTSVEGAVWDAARASHATSGTFGQGVASVTGAVGSVTGGVGGNVAGSVNSVTSSVTVGTNNDKTGYALSAGNITSVAGAVWDINQSSHTNAGTFGKYLDSAISGVSTGGVSAGDIAAAVWNEVQSGHTTAGTFGKYLDSAISGVSTGGLSLSDIADAVWNETRSGHSTSGTFGQGVASVIGSVGSVASSVTVGTNNDKTGYTLSSGGLTSVEGAVWDAARASHTGAGTFGQGVASVTGAVGSVTGDVGGSVGSVLGNVGGSLSGSVGSVGSLSSGALDSVASKVWNESLASHTTAGTVGYVLQPTYFADISFVRDNSLIQDEYTITWFKDGIPVTSGITSPTIQVIKRVDGTNIVFTSSMTEISSGIYKYDSLSSNRVAIGEAAIVILNATIDGSNRIFRKVIGRDS